MYWGVGDRLYACVSEEAEQVWEDCYYAFREPLVCRAKDHIEARAIFKARLERMAKPGHLKGAWV
jgi:hypothetical protein